MKISKIMNQPEDYKRLGINPNKLEPWEDGIRGTDAAGQAEIWYLDCSFDDGSTLVLGTRTKSAAQQNKKGYNPNIAINYTKQGEPTFFDYRLYQDSQVSISQQTCDLKFGPNYLVGEDFTHYNFHVEPELDQEIVMEGKKSVQHKSKIDLHFDAETKPFRPGTGYITFGNVETYYNFICVTRLKVSGTILIDGEQKAVSGSAYYNHQWSNISPTVAFHHWLWGRQNIGKYSVLIYDMVASQQFGLTQIPLFTIDDDQGNRLLEITDEKNVKIEMLDTYVQQATNKEYPSDIRYTFSKGDILVTYEIMQPTEINTIDIYGLADDKQKQQFDAIQQQPTYTR
ncbi:lipocalin-like domain-containing protein [Lentilactobacillus kisonensis]|uniref:AttH domain-containing protein n=1 Tax=Lentilactobacillus kisonensis F0435 TaxID=797516 RepID=H1LCV0_9LACO|nr:lipocalin-like domain-containing protein [Lentilactobacillus kisonensis]EHO53765.1 hypothetical protein HMPREF9104_00414 [Lentilactobacillus kisonensis F0435]